MKTKLNKLLCFLFGHNLLITLSRTKKHEYNRGVDMAFEETIYYSRCTRCGERF